MTEAIVALTEAVKGLDGKSEGDFNKEHEKTFTQAYKNANASNQTESVNFICEAINSGFETPLIWTARLIQKRKSIDFKANADLGHKILDHFLEIDKNCRNSDPKQNLTDVYKAFIKTVKIQKAFEQYQDKMVDIIIKGIGTKESYLHRFCTLPAEHILWNIAIVPTQMVLDAIMETIGKETMYARDDPAGVIIMVLRYINRSYVDTPVTSDLAKPLSVIFHYCSEKDFENRDENRDDEDKKTVYYAILEEIFDSFLLAARDDVNALAPMYADVEKLQKCGEEKLEEKANGLKKYYKPMIGAQMEKLPNRSDAVNAIQNYLDGDLRKGEQFQELYPKYPDVFIPHMDAIFDKSIGAGTWEASRIPKFFSLVSMNHIENVTEGMVKRMIPLLMSDQSKWSAVAFASNVCEKYPRMVAPYADTILEAIRADPNTAGTFAPCLSAFSKLDKKDAKMYCEFIKEMIPKTPEAQRVHLILEYREIGIEFRDVVIPYKPFIKELGEKGSPMIKQHCKAVINELEDRTLENLEKSVKDHDDDIEELDEKVTNTEENVDALGKDVDDTKEKAKETKENVGKVEEHIDDLEQKTEDIKSRVEEIEKRTLSHAPEWAPDICELLNPESPNDWRILAGKLGHSEEDISLWSGLSDPCKFLLDEWFINHKTLQATKDVLEKLRKMKRNDAADIVEKALKAVEDIVHEQPTDYLNPPPIFISYQWGLQEQALQLKRHLQEAGYQGWMDIGQMGGGEKLYEQIDQGIRAAKVVISCVSNKYAESPNCNREVNLSANLKKPIIPLLMEQMPWPPPGGMGPIFGEFLFIRFFSSGGEKASDKQFWPAAKFQELLGQLRYSIPPDQSLVSEQYKDWWKPQRNELIIPSSEAPQQEKIGDHEEFLIKDSANPSVFISYQWDKQPQVKALYNALTKEKYHCWLDINQMGGGDSLYDKIDAGIRSAKVLISCVTKNYALSSNCRREVSLASSLNKPIIPLLMEKMSWPPEGPMADAFTKLVFVNCYKPNIEIQDNWQGQHFDKLLGKIKERVPEPDLEIHERGTEKREQEDNDNQKKDENMETVENAVELESDVEKEIKRTVTPVEEKQSKRTPDSSFYDNKGMDLVMGNKQKYTLKRDARQSAACTLL